MGLHIYKNASKGETFMSNGSKQRENGKYEVLKRLRGIRKQIHSIYTRIEMGQDYLDTIRQINEVEEAMDELKILILDSYLWALITGDLRASEQDGQGNITNELLLLLRRWKG